MHGTTLRRRKISWDYKTLRFQAVLLSPGGPVRSSSALKASCLRLNTHLGP